MMVSAHHISTRNVSFAQLYTHENTCVNTYYHTLNHMTIVTKKSSKIKGNK